VVGKTPAEPLARRSGLHRTQGHHRQVDAHHLGRRCDPCRRVLLGQGPGQEPDPGAAQEAGRRAGGGVQEGVLERAADEPTASRCRES
jgi:hypothetical protein